MTKENKTFRKPEKVEDFLLAACRVMTQKGYAQLSMRDIAVEAGVHKSLLYHYFKNKDELFLELFRFLNQRYVNIIEEVAILPEPIPKKLKTGFQAFQKFVETEPKWILMVIDITVQAVQKSESKKEVISLYSRLMDLITQTYKEGRENKEVEKKFDDQVVSSLILATLMGLGVFYVMDKKLVNFPKAYEYFLKMINQFTIEQ